MTDLRKPNALDSDLDAFVEAFEDAWAACDQPPDVGDFLPSSGHPDGEKITIELLCLDLEFRHQRDDSPDIDLLDHYQIQFPHLLSNPEILRQLAFEDYRWQIQHGRPVTRQDYAVRFAIDTDAWPAPPATTDESNPIAKGSTVRARDEVHRLTEAMRLVPDAETEFQGFEIVRQLGEGQFGRVFLAEQKDLANRHVVLKLSTQLWKEAERLARLQHTNIVPIYSVHQVDGVQAVCMPFLGSQTLKDVLRRIEADGKNRMCGRDLLKFVANESSDELDNRVSNGAASPPPVRHSQRAANSQLAGYDHEQVCLWIVAKLAAGIGHAHDRGILHRDIKPANVLLSTDAEPMMLDFNLSAEMTVGGRSSLVGGTLPYMAPEHIRAVATGEATGVTADIYSLGVILFQLLAGGQLPFAPRSGELEMTMAALLEDRLSAPTLPANTLVSSSAKAIVHKCLAPNPKDRYQSASDLQEDIERHLAHERLKHCPESFGVRMNKWLKRNPQARSAGCIGGVATVLLAIVASVAWVRGDQLANMRALESYRAFVETSDDARATLSTPSIDDSLRHDAMATLQKTLPLFHSASLHTDAAFARLDDEHQARVRETLTELHFLLADDHEHQAALFAGEDRHAALQAALKQNKLAQMAAAKPTWAVLHQQAALLEQLGDAEQAKQVRVTAGDLRTHDRADQYLASLQTIREGEIRVGRDILAKLTEEDPKNFMAWHLLGATQSSLGNFDAAEDCFTHCKAISPDSPLARFQRGVTRLEKKDFAGAKGDFDFVLKLSPSNAATLLSRAHAYRGLGNIQAAIDDLNAAEKSGRYPTRVPLLRAKLWQRMGDTAKADQDRQLGLQSTPTGPEAWVARGLAKLPRDIEGALTDVRSALRIRPQYRVAQHNLAMILAEHTHDYEAALAVYDEMLETQPADWATLRSRAVLYARMGVSTKATSDLAQVFAGDRSAQTYYQAACVYSLISGDDQKKQKQAIALLRKSLQMDGGTWLDFAKKDNDLAAIRHHSEFQSLIAAMEAVFDQP